MEETANVANEECVELKNIKYKTMLLNGSPIKETTMSNDISNLDKFLELEKTNNSNEPWCKLNKTIKTKKLIEFVTIYVNENQMTAEEGKLLIVFLKVTITHLCCRCSDWRRQRRAGYSADCTCYGCSVSNWLLT